MQLVEYVLAASAEEALATLTALRGDGRVIAGGTDLMLQLQTGDRASRGLVDVTRIPGLDEIVLYKDVLQIGAAATFARIAASPLVQRHAPVLAEAAGWVGSPQIRNVGTLAGNVVNAMPAADGSIALLALDAEAEIANLTGRQWIPVKRLFVSPGVSRVDATSEMLTAFRFPIQRPGEGSAYQRFARRKAVALPLINVAVTVCLDSESHAIADARIAVGPVAPVPFRSTHAETALRGQQFNSELVEAAADLAASEARPRDSLLRAGKQYRQELIRVLVRRALTAAYARARG